MRARREDSHAWARTPYGTAAPARGRMEGSARGGAGDTCFSRRKLSQKAKQDRSSDSTRCTIGSAGRTRSTRPGDWSPRIAAHRSRWRHDRPNRDCRGRLAALRRGIADALRTKTYRARSRTPRLHPKANGKLVHSASRRSGIAWCRWRLDLEPIFEMDFLDCSYGFRPKGRPIKRWKPSSRISGWTDGV
jgi:hypothetical protein